MEVKDELREEFKRIEKVKVVSVDAKSILGDHVITRDLNVKRVFDLVIVFNDEQIEFALVKIDEIRDVHLLAETFETDIKDILDIKGKEVWIITDKDENILAMGDREKYRLAILKSLFPLGFKVSVVRRKLKNKFPGITIVN